MAANRAAKSTEAMDKYMNPVPPYLSDLVANLNKDLSTLPEWEITLTAQLKASVQYRIRDHFEASAMTRQKFVSLSTNLWQEDDSKLFSLVETPRKVLGYLPKEELARLEDLVRVPMTQHAEELRATLDDTMESMRASESDRAEIAEVMGKTTFFFRDLEEHHAAEEKWTPLRNIKVPIISELEQREEFLEEIEEFENKSTGDKDRYHKANSLALADENKFRAYAAKKLKELDSKAIKLCRLYESDTGRRFEIDGVYYLEMIKEQKFGRSSTPGLSLAKLRPGAIPIAERQKYAGGPASNLTPDAEIMSKRTSLTEQGEDPKIIRHKPLETTAHTTNAAKLT